jgi:hypothetical protein
MMAGLLRGGDGGFGPGSSDEYEISLITINFPSLSISPVMKNTPEINSV